MIGLKWSLWESLLSSVSTCWVESLQCGVFATNQCTQIVATLISCWSRHPRCSWRWVATVEVKGSPICMWVWLSGLWSSRRTWSEWRVKFFISSGCPRFFTLLLIRSRLLFSLKFRNTSPQLTLSHTSRVDPTLITTCGLKSCDILMSPQILAILSVIVPRVGYLTSSNHC